MKRNRVRVPANWSLWSSRGGDKSDTRLRELQEQPPSQRPADDTVRPFLRDTSAITERYCGRFLRKKTCRKAFFPLRHVFTFLNT